MMMNETSSIYAAEDEVDVWRDKINTTIQKMTPSEITEYYRRKTEPIMQQYGIKVMKPITNYQTA
ncbi:MAG: hypothetical protein LBM77_05540 [Spirochaetaceae bacterium]|jgi:hypothetical protein|nr:hypothetical protein [Spirochaetaceae bacterium]